MNDDRKETLFNMYSDMISPSGKYDDELRAFMEDLTKVIAKEIGDEWYKTVSGLQDELDESNQMIWDIQKIVNGVNIYKTEN